MIFPELLTSGDSVRIISPSGPVLQKHLEFGLQLLKDWGLHIEMDPFVFQHEALHDDTCFPYLAATDQQRLDAIQNAIEDPKIKALFFSRGGYGLSRIVSKIDFRALRENSKWFVGFSDITALHLKAFEANIGTLHGPVVKSFDSQIQDIDRLHQLLFDNKKIELSMEYVGSFRQQKGILWGGNLSLVVAELATGAVHIPKDSIVILEDVGEADYRLDRLLTTFGRAAVGRKICAVFLGTFTGCEGSYYSADAMPHYIRRLALELASRLDCPVYLDLPIGHGSRNISFLMGGHATIDGSNIIFEAVK